MAKLEMKSVNSSLISAVGYDEEKQNLRVSLCKGDTYSYQGVPTEIHQKLLKSRSKGRYFAQNIAQEFKGKKVKS
jgi:hypothetical protein